MADDDRGGSPDGAPGWPFGSGFDLSEMMRMLQSEGPVNWQVAEQVATATAVADPAPTEGADPALVAPTDPARLMELVRAAQVHVASATGLAAVHTLEPEGIDRDELARRTLHGLHPVLESLATTLQGPMREAAGDTPPPTNPFAALASEEGMQGLLLMLAPVLLGVQAGAMAGHLAHDGLARYDHMLPLSDDADLAFVVSNIGRFANEWSLELDDVSFAVALRELVRAGQRTVPWLAPALVERALRFVTGYDAAGDDLEARLGDFELGDVSSMQDLLGDPSSVLGMIRSPEQEPARADLHRLVAVLEGYTDIVVASIGERLVTSFGRIDEALRRRRLERGSAGAFLDQLLGLDVTRDDFEAGRAFCGGVVEREGIDGLNRLWDRVEHVPTTAEVGAPGLWLARIDLG